MHPAWGHLHANDETPAGAVDRPPRRGRAPVGRAGGAAAALGQAAAIDGPGHWASWRSTATCCPARPSRPTGEWQVIDTGLRPSSHISLHQPERRLLIRRATTCSGVSLYFDEGHTPDPVGEFLEGLDRVAGTRGLDARLALAGHGRPFTDVAMSRPTARSSPSASTVCGGPGRGARERVRAGAARLRRGVLRADRELAAGQDALLAHAPRAWRPAGRAGDEAGAEICGSFGPAQAPNCGSLGRSGPFRCRSALSRYASGQVESIVPHRYSVP